MGILHHGPGHSWVPNTALIKLMYGDSSLKANMALLLLFCIHTCRRSRILGKESGSGWWFPKYQVGSGLVLGFSPPLPQTQISDLSTSLTAAYPASGHRQEGTISPGNPPQDFQASIWFHFQGAGISGCPWCFFIHRLLYLACTPCLRFCGFYWGVNCEMSFCSQHN